jgi:hypothetical protein
LTEKTQHKLYVLLDKIDGRLTEGEETEEDKTKKKFRHLQPDYRKEDEDVLYF